MNTDFIRWMIGYAEGFELEKRDYHDQWDIYFKRYYIWGCTALDAIKHFKQEDYHIILLQKAIEGINQINHKYRIEIAYNMVEVLDSEEYTVLETWEINKMTDDYDLLTFDQAKEEALKYIWEQEKKK